MVRRRSVSTGYGGQEESANAFGKVTLVKDGPGAMTWLKEG